MHISKHIVHDTYIQFLSVNLKTKKLSWQEKENKDLVEVLQH